MSEQHRKKSSNEEEDPGIFVGGDVGSSRPVLQRTN
jgi:hypothetical protein